MTQIAAARTFTIYEDIEELLKLGKIKGGSLDCAVVIRGDKIISKEPLRFKDEFVRHKILDIVGDVMLLGMPLKAHIVATRPGHAINAELTKDPVREAGGAEERPEEKKSRRPLDGAADGDVTRCPPDPRHAAAPLSVHHDRSGGGVHRRDELVAIKNVTINEPFFQGHFPGNPVMPGVLQLEAMAQAAGILMLRRSRRKGKPRCS